MLGEHDENELRKDFTPSERVAIAAAVVEAMGERRGGDTSSGEQSNVQNFEQWKGTKTDNIAAKKAGFGNAKTYQQAKAVITTGTPELVEAMDSGKVAISTAAVIAGDGFHRHGGAKKAGLATITADIRQGTRRDAVLFSVGANASHGLRRTNEDKRRAVETMLRDEEWRGEGIRWMARKACVSEGFVHKMYHELLSVHGEQIEKPDVREVTRNGVTYEMNTSHIGLRSADPEMAESPTSDTPATPEIRPTSEAPALTNEAVLEAAASLTESAHANDNKAAYRAPFHRCSAASTPARSSRIR